MYKRQVEGGYDPTYGARPLKRYLQKHVETLAAKLMLEGEIRAGETIVIDVENEKLAAHIQEYMQVVPESDL